MPAVPVPARLATRPADRLAELAQRTSPQQVAQWCAALFADPVPGDPVLLDWLVGPQLPAGYDAWVRRPTNASWPQVWALRGLLHVWHPDGTDTVAAGLRHERWRPRETASRVVAAHALTALAGEVEPLVHDDVERVRGAAARALVAVRRTGPGR